MSFRPPFSNANNTFPSLNSNSIPRHVNIVPQTSTHTFQGSIQNNFPNCHYANSTNVNRYPSPVPNSLGISPNIIGTNNVYNNAPPSKPPLKPPPLPHPNLMRIRPPNLINSASQPRNVNPSFHQNRDQSYNRNAVSPFTLNSNNVDVNFVSRNIPVQRFPPPVPNITGHSLPQNTNYPKFQDNACVNKVENVPASFPPPVPNITGQSLPPNTNYPKFKDNPCVNKVENVPVSLPNIPRFCAPMHQNTTSILNTSVNYSVENVNNSVLQPVIYSSPVTAKPALPTMITSSKHSPAILLSNSALEISRQLPPNSAYNTQNLNIPSNPLIHDKEIKVTAFLAKFSAKQKEKEHQVTIPEFRYIVKAAIRMIQLLKERKVKLSKLLDSSDSEWKSEAENTLNEQEELSALISVIKAPEHLKNAIGKLRLIKKRRGRKKNAKQNKLSEKMIADQKRKIRDQEIDKWLDDISEKNQKIKREAELKKEADFILLEVRRKIYEGRKTIEKIKAFEKLRSARQANATQKGLHVLSMHNIKFEKKMSILKETMVKQLADYEAEEKALKVMLETEQEGQREEEVQWKIKKMKTLQQRKQKNIMECLFGLSEDPLPTDPLYLFHKYHTSATSTVENLIQIRQQWDIHIAEDGEVIPQHWVVPVAPSNTSWKQCLEV